METGSNGAKGIHTFYLGKEFNNTRSSQMVYDYAWPTPLMPFAGVPCACF